VLPLSLDCKCLKTGPCPIQLWLSHDVLLALVRQSPHNVRQHRGLLGLRSSSWDPAEHGSSGRHLQPGGVIKSRHPSSPTISNSVAKVPAVLKSSQVLTPDCQLGEAEGHMDIKGTRSNWALVAHACNPSYSGGRDQEDHSSKPPKQTVFETLLKKPITKKG
jgi:hypothetical protein